MLAASTKPQRRQSWGRDRRRASVASLCALALGRPRCMSGLRFLFRRHAQLLHASRALASLQSRLVARLGGVGVVVPPRRRLPLGLDDRGLAGDAAAVRAEHRGGGIQPPPPARKRISLARAEPRLRSGTRRSDRSWSVHVGAAPQLGAPPE